jgi:hypothetical protein
MRKRLAIKKSLGCEGLWQQVLTGDEVDVRRWKLIMVDLQGHSGMKGDKIDQDRYGSK